MSDQQEQPVDFPLTPHERVILESIPDILQQQADQCWSEEKEMEWRAFLTWLHVQPPEVRANYKDVRPLWKY